MNITQSTTTPAASGQDIALRTLASDISSLEQGNQIPVAERILARPQETIQPDAIVVRKEGVSVPKLVLAILFLVATGIAMYIYIYPYMVDIIQPS